MLLNIEISVKRDGAYKNTISRGIEIKILDSIAATFKANVSTSDMIQKLIDEAIDNYIIAMNVRLPAES